MSPRFVVFLLDVACAEILGRILRHVAPRRGAPSPATALRLLHERERALTQRELEWTYWASYVAGLAQSAQLVLPPMPGASAADGLVEGG
jgi:hypothetical protein